VRKLLIISLLFLLYAFVPRAQQANCNLKSPYFTIHFGAGNVSEDNGMVPARYARVSYYCPSDGHYTFTPYTSDCFRGDWHTLTEDHTPGDNNGNMLLVNSSPRSGMFFSTSVTGLKPNTMYEFGVWMMNVCRITEKCPYPLLPDITIHILTPDGKNVAQLSLGEVNRVQSPKWSQFQLMFTTPSASANLNLVMINNAPGGCGNDFVMDDLTFRECVIPPPVAVKKSSATLSKKTTPVKKTVAPAEAKPVVKTPAKPVIKSEAKVTQQPIAKTVTKKPVKTAPKSTAKPVTKPAVKPVQKPIVKSAPKSALKPAQKPEPKVAQSLQSTRQQFDSTKDAPPVVKPRTVELPPAPAALKARTNALVKRIVTGPGEIRIDLYDNGEIDDDTVSIYHNNRLLAARARLSQKAISFRIKIDESKPHHELVMVADNLGSIPPNTSLMIVTAGDKRHEVFISSTKQKNAKVVLDLE
jgi:hypothetical protein